MVNFKKEISDFHKSQQDQIDNWVEKPLENRDLVKSILEDNLVKSSSSEEFYKSFSGDLQKKFPNATWKTINGAKVLINGKNVVAGLDGFNGMIDKFFDEKKKESGSKSNKVVDKKESKEKTKIVDKQKKSESKGYDELNKLPKMTVKELIENKVLSSKDFELNNVVAIEKILKDSKTFEMLYNEMTKTELKGTKRQIAYANDLREKTAKQIAIWGCKEVALIVLGDSDVDMKKWQRKNTFPMITSSAGAIIDYCKTF